jgi:O-antigen/teichoic acid export membrane protein
VKTAAITFGLGSAWAYVQAFAVRAITGIGFVLAGVFLEPTDFGRFAVVAAFLMLAEMVCEQVWSQCLLQRQEESEADTGTVFLLAAACGLLMSVVCWFAAPRIGGLFGDQAGADLLRLAAACPLLMALTAVPSGLLRRRLAFAALAQRSLVAGSGSVALGVGLLMAGFGVQALVLQAVAYWTLNALMLWIKARPSLVWQLSLQRGLELARLAVVNAVSKLADVVEMRGMELAIGHFAGLAAMGAFAFAMRLAQTAFQVVAGPALDVTFGDAARSLQSQRPDSLNKGLVLVNLIAIPTLLGLALVGPLLMQLVYGDRWKLAEPLVFVLALALSVRAVLYVCSVVIQASGGTARAMPWSVLRALIALFLLVLAMGQSLPLPLAAAAYGVAALAVLPGVLFLLRSLLGSEVQRCWPALKASMPATALAGVAALPFIAVQAFGPVGGLEWLFAVFPALAYFLTYAVLRRNSPELVALRNKLKQRLLHR